MQKQKLGTKVDRLKTFVQLRKIEYNFLITVTLKIKDKTNQIPTVGGTLLQVFVTHAT